MTASAGARAASWYLDHLGWVLAPIPPGQKGPTLYPGWNTPERWLDSPEQIYDHWGRHPSDGVGVIHAPSDTAVIDPDDQVETAHLFAGWGLDLEALLAAGLRWRSARGEKVIYTLPAGLVVPAYKYIIPAEPKPRTIFELRSGLLQDVLPPTRHPSGAVYTWVRGPQQIGRVPEIPDELVDLWRRLAAPTTPAALPPARRAPQPGGSVIDTFNTTFTVIEILERFGYRRPRRGQGRRLLAPTSSTGIPGVVILDGKAYSHHGADPLADGRAHSAFDVFCRLHYHNDVRAAVRAAAEILGL